MELIIGLFIVSGLVWFFFFRDKETVNEATSFAPYKVESAPVLQETPDIPPVVIEEGKPKAATKKRTVSPKVVKPKVESISKPASNKTKPKSAAKIAAPPKPKLPVRKVKSITK